LYSLLTTSPPANNAEHNVDGLSAHVNAEHDETLFPLLVNPFSLMSAALDVAALELLEEDHLEDDHHLLELLVHGPLTQLDVQHVGPGFGPSQ